MSKIIIYYSMTGNTESIALKLGADTNALVKNVSDTTVEEALTYDTIILGCPAMGGEGLEEDTFEPFNNELFHKLENQRVFLFGSYGWGSGEWMENWITLAKEEKVNLGDEEGLIVNGDESNIIQDKYDAFVAKINQ